MPNVSFHLSVGKTANHRATLCSVMIILNDQIITCITHLHDDKSYEW